MYRIRIFSACAGNALVSPCTTALNPDFIVSVMPDSGLDQFDFWVATPSTIDLVPLVMVPVATNALTTLPDMIQKGRYNGISASSVGRDMKIGFEGVPWNIYVGVWSDRDNVFEEDKKLIYLRCRVTHHVKGATLGEENASDKLTARDAS